MLPSLPLTGTSDPSASGEVDCKKLVVGKNTSES
jgi:hypothetical protein